MSILAATSSTDQLTLNESEFATVLSLDINPEVDSPILVMAALEIATPPSMIYNPSGVQLAVDGTALPGAQTINGQSLAYSVSWAVQIPAGSHTVELQAYAVAGGAGAPYQAITTTAQMLAVVAN